MVNLNLVRKGGEKDEYGLSWAVSLKAIMMSVKKKSVLVCCPFDRTFIDSRAS